MSYEDDARTIAGLEAGRSNLFEGVCEGYDFPNRLVLVNLGGSLLRMPHTGDHPWKGDRVRVIFAGEKPVCIGPHGSAMGTVQSVASNIATVLGDDGRVYRYAVTFGASLSNGHRVRLDHAGQLVVARYATEPLASDYTSPGAPPERGGSATFRPVDSGCWSLTGAGFRGPLVEVNAVRRGVYWYGTQMRDTIPDDATITRAELRLIEEYDYYPGSAAQIGRHTQATRDGTVPDITADISITDGGTYDIRGVIADSLKTGAALGVGFPGGDGQRAFGPYSTSGSIYIEWQ